MLEVRVFYKSGASPESFLILHECYCKYESGMLMLVDHKELCIHLPQSDIERVEIEEVKEESEKEVT